MIDPFNAESMPSNLVADRVNRLNASPMTLILMIDWCSDKSLV